MSFLLVVPPQISCRMHQPLIAVDIGNTRIKLGLFGGQHATLPQAETPIRQLDLPKPVAILALPALDWDEHQLRSWLNSDITGAIKAAGANEIQWWIASVNRPAAAKLTQWIASNSPNARVRILAHSDLPITAAVEHPDRVGIDRLAGAAAANRLRNPARPAIIVGVGTAITVDLVAADGVFQGGAILPGIGMSARALEAFTDLLPHSPVDELATAPPALGATTLDAIHSGLYWGAVGAMRELIARQSEGLFGAADSASASAAVAIKPDVFLTGGAAASVAQTLDPAARYCEHLVLSGISLANPQR
ncbi:MAG TPA: type III pantothenate kinase [Pirellulales bacterium]